MRVWAVMASLLGCAACSLGPFPDYSSGLDRSHVPPLDDDFETGTLLGTENPPGKWKELLRTTQVKVAPSDAGHRGAYGLSNGLASTAGTALVLYAGAHRVLSGALTVGGLLVFLAYLRTAQGAAHGLLAAYVDLKTAEASAARTGPTK